MRVTLRIPDSEMQRLVRDARAWEAASQKEVQKLIARTALAIDREAKRLAPVDTGRLRSSIRADLTDIANLRASVGTDVNYALYVEMGTSRMLARPFLRPAYERHIPAFLKELKRIYSA